MTVLAKWVVVLAFAAAVMATVRYYRGKSSKAMEAARTWLVISAYGVIFASLLLLTLLLRHDFSNGYVYSHSSRDLPLHFLISSFYAGQEGSFLFWVLCSAIASLVLIRIKAGEKSERWVLTVFMAVQSILLLLVIAKSPFRFVWDMFPEASFGQIPPDGRGLNPLLQNFWMVVHPPVLFIGFAVMAVPFSYAIAGLWRKDFAILTSHAFPWVLFASGVLGVGIMLGAYWAYGVLGWGGYWGWDPVENSSLVPWITCIALIHTLLAQRRTGRFTRTNFFLAIVSFVLVVYSTFLTRSGVLGDSSVHSFADPGATVYWLLIVFLFLLMLVGFGLILLRRAELTPQKPDTRLFSRETWLGAGAVALLLSAAVILFGTSLPIFSKSSVDPSFYDTMNFPIAIAIALLIGFSLYTHWAMDDGKGMIRRALLSLTVSLAASVVLFFFGIENAGVLGFVFASVFALVVNAEIGWKVAKGDPRFLGGKLAHIGLALFFLGVIATGKYSTMQHVSLPLNTPQKAVGYTLTYVGYGPPERGRFAFNILVEKGSDRFHLAPVMFDGGQQGTMRSPDIESFFTQDLYISPISLHQPLAQGNAGDQTHTTPKGGSVATGDVEVTFVGLDTNKPAGDAMGQQEETLVVEASVKPFINLVWGGTVVMVVGFILSILKRSKEQ